jgi:hypothetical protein
MNQFKNNHDGADRVPLPLESEGFTSHAAPAVASKEEETSLSALPVLTTAGDIRELVQYLSGKPAGVIFSEELDRVKKRLFEPRKLAAFDRWGLIRVNGESLQLTRLGHEVARKLEPEAEVFRHILERMSPYRAALDWIREQTLDIVTTTDVANLWREAHFEPLDFGEGELMKGAVVSFFNLCHAAGIGTMTLGKRGHTTRLSIDREGLRAFLDEDAACRSESTDPGQCPGEHEAVGHGNLLVDRSPLSLVAWRRERNPLRLLVVGSRESAVVDLIRRTLEFAGVERHVVELDWDDQSSLGGETFGFMREHDVVIIVIDENAVTKDDAGKYTPKEKLLVGIGAALMTFGERVILLSDDRFSTLEDFWGATCEKFAGGNLSWDSGLRLLIIIADFRHRSWEKIAHHRKTV